MPKFLDLTTKEPAAQTPPGVPSVVSSPLAETIANPVRGGGLAPFVLPKELFHAAVSWAQANVRPLLDVFPQEAPDPKVQGMSYGDIPSRAPRQQIAVMSYPDEHVWGGWSSDHFQIGKHGPTPHTVSYPQGEMQGAGVRPNVVRPPAMAYGSLFALSPAGHGFE